MAVPVAGPTTQPYGQTGFALEPGGFHDGIDIGASCGSPVAAAGGGTVTRAGWDSTGYGNLVWIDHQNGISTFYGHLSSIAVGVGQQVAEGQTIGAVGSTGNSTGCHLHYGMHAGGQSVPPNYSPGGSSMSAPVAQPGLPMALAQDNTVRILGLFAFIAIAYELI